MLQRIQSFQDNNAANVIPLNFDREQMRRYAENRILTNSGGKNDTIASYAWIFSGNGCTQREH